MKEINRLIKSFGYALCGIAQLFIKEKNAHIHAIAAVTVTILGIICGITPQEWTMIIVCFMSVIGAEAFNTSIERVVDLASPQYHPLAKQAKDIAAGAVLVFAIGSAIIGLIIFLPYC